MLNCTGVWPDQVVFTVSVCLGAGEEEEESMHSHYSPSSENQSGCSVAALFMINTRLFI